MEPIPQPPGLPHREPFVFVDRIIEIDSGVAATCEKIFPSDAPVFRGHFPGNPLVPGVLLTEALAQTAGIAAAGGNEGRQFLLSAISSMKFPAAARPDESLRLDARKSGSMGGLWMFDVRASVGHRVVAEGRIVLSESPG